MQKGRCNMTEPVNGKRTDKVSTQSYPKNTTTQHSQEKSNCIFTDGYKRPKLNLNIPDCPAMSTRVETTKCILPKRLEESMEKQQEARRKKIEAQKIEEAEIKQISTLIEKNIESKGGDSSTKDVPY